MTRASRARACKLVTCRAVAVFAAAVVVGQPGEARGGTPDEVRPTPPEAAPVAGSPDVPPSATPPSTVAPGTATKSLELPEVLASVNRAFPSIVAALRDQATADADLLSAEGAFDPTVKARGGANGGYYDYGRVDVAVEQPTPWWGASFVAGWRFGRGFSADGAGDYSGIPSYYGNLATFDAGELRAGVNVPLWRNGPIDRRRANIQRAELGQRIAKLSTEQQRIEAARAAAHRYWEWVAAGAKLAIAHDWLEIARTRDEALGKRVASGDLPAFEQVENRRALVQREGAVVSATRSLEQASFELSMYLRDARGEPLVPDAGRLPPGFPSVDALPAATVADDVARAHRTRPEPSRFSAQREQLEVERRFAENQLAPGIDLSLVGSKDLGSATPGLSPKLASPTIEAGIVIDIPIPNRAARGRVAAARAGAEKIDAQAQLVRDRIATDVRDATSAMRAARQRVDVAHREVAVAVELETGERKRFELGESTLLIVNMREQATADARLREVDAKVDYHRAAASYRAALGELGR